ncbi:MAG: hypothetical protein KTR13_05295 [Saprospiraceae bacterium]|nr:hypothetical protein [Saprospiraceae bacterium]
MSNTPFFKEVFTIPESKRKDIEKALENLDYNGIAIFSSELPEKWSPAGRETLEKIVALTGRALVNALNFEYADNQLFAEVLNMGSTEYVLVFSDKIQAKGLNFNVRQHQWVRVNNKYVFFSRNLEDFIVDRAAKMALWKAIQEQFDQNPST